MENKITLFTKLAKGQTKLNSVCSYLAYHMGTTVVLKSIDKLKNQKKNGSKD